MAAASGSAVIQTFDPRATLRVMLEQELDRRWRTRKRFTFRGVNAVVQKYVNPPRPAEFVLEGSSETGKTFASLHLLDALARKYRKARLAIIRQYHVDLSSTVLDLFKREFVEPAGDIRTYGGESATFYDYPNGSRIWCFGMDRSTRVLSGAFDVIYFNQCDESKKEGWETLSTRTTGRAGVIVPGILYGDMNPAPQTFWLYSREQAGKVKILTARFADNPSLYDDAGNPTAQGNETMGRLANLTGTLRMRLYEGKRASVEGLVYGEVWDESECVTEAAEYVPDGGEIFWACDDGYSAGSSPNGRDPQTGFYVADAHPRVFLLCQLKPDGHLDIFNESYAVLKLTDEHISEVKALGFPNPQIAAHGPGSAEFRGRLLAAGLLPRQCADQVETTIKETRSWFAADTNKVRRVRVHPRCRQFRAEMNSYAYDPVMQKPIKAHDHGPDAIRYLIWALRLRR
jgi:hypothetical protein